MPDRILKYIGLLLSPRSWRSDRKPGTKASAVMCIYLFYQFRKRRNRNGRSTSSRSKEPSQAKQAPPCEHQIAAASHLGPDGILGGFDYQQLPAGQRGSKYCPECIIEKRRATIYKWKVIVALVVPNIMASMDMTILATALPTIASHFCKYILLSQKALSSLIDHCSRTSAVQLDRDCVHPGVNFVNPAVWADRRRVRPAFSHPGIDLLRADRQCTCCKRTGMGHVASGSCLARTRLRWTADSHQSHSVGQGVVEAERVQ